MIAIDALNVWDLMNTVQTVTSVPCVWAWGIAMSATIAGIVPTYVQRMIALAAIIVALDTAMIVVYVIFAHMIHSAKTAKCA